MNNKTNIRIIQKKEWQEYKDIRLKSLKDEPLLFGSSFEKSLEKNKKDWKKHLGKIFVRDQATTVGIWEDQRIVGIAAGVRHNIEIKLKHIAEIHAIYILPEYRKKGLASKLLNSLIEHIKLDSNISVLFLRVYEENKPAVCFYQKHNFEEIGTFKHAAFYKGVFYDDILMQKIL